MTNTLFPYNRHVLIYAEPEQAQALKQRLAELVEANALNKADSPKRVLISLCDALEGADNGPIVVVYPEGVWYHKVDLAALEEIFQQHILQGKPVAESILYRYGQSAPEATGGSQIEASPEDEERRKAIRAERKKKGLLIVNTGNGKGKTTAALGVLLRAWGRDMRVGGVQFFKHENANFGELRALNKMGVELTPMGDGFTWTSRDIDETQAKALHGWEIGKQRILSGNYDIFLLDEFTYLMHFGWLDTNEVVAWIKANKPPMLHLIITGRDAPQGLIEAADLVSDINEVKHPYRDQGIPAQKGIEF
jgi:cob(I)alamin adenosyltransferase